jgi:importin subunit alpha-1
MLSAGLPPPPSRVAARSSLKQGLSASSCRAKREETTVQLRKNKREEGLAKRRNLSSVAGGAQPESALCGDPFSTNLTAANISSDDASAPAVQAAGVADMPRLKAVLLDLSSPVEQLRSALKSFRKLLSWEVNPPTTETISMGLLPVFVAYLTHSDSDCRFESCWALTNVAATDRTRDVAMEPNCLDFLIRALDDEDAQVREQAGWCLGNIAGDCVELR